MTLVSVFEAAITISTRKKLVQCIHTEHETIAKLKITNVMRHRTDALHILILEITEPRSLFQVPLAEINKSKTKIHFRSRWNVTEDYRVKTVR